MNEWLVAIAVFAIFGLGVFAGIWICWVGREEDSDS